VQCVPIMIATVKHPAEGGVDSDPVILRLPRLANVLRETACLRYQAQSLGNKYYRPLEG
jgi:hypothetical protein